MRTIAQFNKNVTNPVLKLWAPYLRHMAIIEHKGRKSGKTYQTPVMAFVENGALSVVLNYGTKSDWVQNVRSAGSAVVVYRGKRYKLTAPRIMPIDSADLPRSVRAIRDPARTVLRGSMTSA